MNDKKQAIQLLLGDISQVAQKIGKPVKLMEVCGTHTQTAAQYGIRSVLPENVELITGPGCPVCVTDQYDIDCMVHLALNGVPLAVYGDVLRVPGTKMSLEQAKMKGAIVEVVYSTEDALILMKQYPDLVFFGLGFETTAPMTASAIKRGLTVYSTHKFFVPAMQALLDMGDINIDGFIGPGHVSAILGTDVYQDLGVPLVVTGFEGDDMLLGIYMLLQQLASNQSKVENQYNRVVKKSGNSIAWDLINEVFEKGDAYWRGFGVIPGSGMVIKDDYSDYNACVKYKDLLKEVQPSKEFKGCSCGEIIRGLKKPEECPLFGKQCNPDNPFGPCMVSVEGACNVSFRYNQ